jgi:5-methylcytosine-specific restriction endonuclease McrA
MATRREHSARPNRESLSKRLGKVARQIRERDGHACVYCGATAETSGAHLHLDHLTPKSKGGEDVPTNLALACRRCNSARQNMSLAQWAAYAAEVYGLTFTARSIRARARRKLAA